MKIVKLVKYTAIVIFCSILDMMLHAITSKISPFPKEANFSFLVKTIGAVGAATVWVLVAFSSVAYVFYKCEDKILGIKSGKGLRYGSAIGLLWLWGMLETISLSGTSLIYEGVMGICDAIPVILMGLLLGKYTSEKIFVRQKNKSFKGINIYLPISIFNITFLVGRYFFYFTKIIDSGYETRPFLTFIWTLLMGVCIGIAYLLLGEAARSQSRILGAIKFGVVIFGVNWFAFFVFAPIIFSGTLIDTLLKLSVDIFLVSLSCYLSEILIKTNCHKRKYKVLDLKN
ncbi:hypothetical protein NL50_08665 [Clostridium acetobutylicum]|nr:hypothetical protein NL50_08665 [Clostridium acetobutylicum]